MRTVFIIIAIFVAVILLVRFAAPHAKPRFDRFERIPETALISSIRALGAKCAVTEHGLGIDSTLRMRYIIYECEKRVQEGRADDWQHVIDESADNIISALYNGKKDVRYAAYCGHVGKFPRVYLFCETLVGLSGCEITCELILSAISAFEEKSEFTVSERKILCGTLKFCLIGFLHRALDNALACDKMYDKGVFDGKDGRVNLDYIHDDDYICGLLDGFSQTERDAVVRLLEYNNVDNASAEKNRRKALSQTFLTVNSVLRSLNVVEEIKDEICPKEQHGGERAERYVRVFNVLFPVMLAVYAIFTCIFASPKYVALFSVAAIITYCVMRVPILLYTPKGGIDIFSPIEKMLSRFFVRKTHETQKNSRLLLSETAYFGGEAEHIESTIDGSISVCCDNRGAISLKHGSVCDRLYIGIRSDGESASLSECDGAIERHRATYRICKHDLEFCAEVISPIDCTACIVCISIVNRSNTDKIMQLVGAVVRTSPKIGICKTEDIAGGAIAACDNGFALSVGENGEYGGDLSAYCKTRTLKHAKTNGPALIGACSVNVKPFSLVRLYVKVIYANGSTEAESIFRQTSDRLYFVRAVQSAAVYCRDNEVPTTHSEPMPCRAINNQAVYPPPGLPEPELLFSMPFGGIAESGDIVVSDNCSLDPIENIICNDNLSLGLDQFGIQNISTESESLTPPADTYAHQPTAYVIIGESGVLWSPTVKPLGRGKIRTVHSRGYSEYSCAYNGAVCVQRCFAAVGKPYVFVEVTLQNKVDTERKFDIMFSAECNANAAVAISDDGIKAGKTTFCAVGEKPEYALYKESFFIYGNIACSSGFRDGGSTPCPTLSVKKTVGANGCACVLFCITRGEAPSFDTNLIFDEVRSFFGRLGRICPKSDDNILNMSYYMSLYRAYCAFISRKKTSAAGESFLLSAVKYVDPTAVKNRIYEIISEQDITGRFSEKTDLLQFVYSVVEYAEFSQDGAFWNEVLPYATDGRRKVKKDTVYTHILRAVEYIILNGEPKQHSLVQRIWQYKSLIAILRFFEDRISKNQYLFTLYKKRFSDAAEWYSTEVKRLTANTFFEFSSVGEAYMCAKLLFDLDLNERAYNIIKFNNPIERLLHYGERSESDNFDCFSDACAAAVYFTTVTERLFGVKFRGKTAKICPHTAANTPNIRFDIRGKTRDIHITVDDESHSGSWKMIANKINYPADSVDIGELGGDVTFYRGQR